MSQKNRDLLKYNNIKNDFNNNFLTLDICIKNQNIKSKQTYYNICKRLNLPSIANTINNHLPHIEQRPPPYSNGGSNNTNNVIRPNEIIKDSKKYTINSNKMSGKTNSINNIVNKSSTTDVLRHESDIWEHRLNNEPGFKNNIKVQLISEKNNIPNNIINNAKITETKRQKNDNKPRRVNIGGLLDDLEQRRERRRNVRTTI